MLRNDPAWTQMCMGIQNRIIEHHVQIFGTESVHIFFYDVTLERAAHHGVICRFRVPDTEAAMVLGRQAAVGHPGRLRRTCPLTAIQFHRVEQFRRGIRIRPILVHVGRHIEMNEHTETKVHETALQGV